MIERNEDAVDRWLREDARRSLADDAFTRRVVESLPRHAVRGSSFRPALILGSTALGCALAALLSPVGPTIVEGLLELGRVRGLTPAVSAVLAMTVALAVSGYVLASEE
jgi:hypothetical protein